MQKQHRVHVLANKKTIEYTITNNKIPVASRYEKVQLNISPTITGSPKSFDNLLNSFSIKIETFLVDLK